MRKHSELRHASNPTLMDNASKKADIDRCDKMRKIIKKELPLMGRDDVSDIRMVARRVTLQTIRNYKREIDEQRYADSSDDGDVGSNSEYYDSDEEKILAQYGTALPTFCELSMKNPYIVTPDNSF